MNNPSAIVLNAGDNFQGTIWYNIYKWNVTQHFLNKLPIDAYVLGNHEFDDQIKDTVSFIKALNAPVLVSNVDDTDEPDFQKIYKKSTVIYRDGRKIGIIGIILSTTNKLAQTGQLRFLDELESINKEAHRLVTNENVDTIIVVSHCGYEVEKRLAMMAPPKVTLIVGGHSHSLLYNEKTTPNNMTAHGPYPTVVKTRDGRKVLVVQAASFALYLGDITINYNDNGEIVSWLGNPIHLNNSIPQDKEINAELDMWRANIIDISNTVIGRSEVYLDHSRCLIEECNFGNLVADAMVAEYYNSLENDAWAYATIALLNIGTIRISIPPGDITLRNLLEAVPFDNTVDVGEIKGRYIKEMLEKSAAPYRNQLISHEFNFLSLSGLHIKVNRSRSVGSRVESINVLCRKCKVPKYKPLKLNKYYRIVLNSFTRKGGDNFEIISKNLINYKVGNVYSNVLRRYIEKHSPIVHSVEGRIKVVH